MATGTNGNDTLNATIVGEVLSGLDGADSLVSNGFNLTNLIGGIGNDNLDSDYAVTTASGAAILVQQSQNGGENTDRLDLDLDISSSGAITSATSQIGGLGNDSVTADQILSTSAAMTLNSVGDGGRGNDTIRFDTDVQGSSTNAQIEHTGFGGFGNDIITSLIIDSTNFAFGTATSSMGANLFGGGGDDSIRSDVSSQAGAFSFVEGGAGNDTLRINLEGSLASNDVVSAFADGGTGSDLIDVEARNLVGDASIFVDILGDFGNDTIVSDVDGRGDGSIGVLDMVVDIDGGANNDSITSTFTQIKVSAIAFTNNVDVSIDGGIGNDTINSSVSFDGFGGAGFVNDHVLNVAPGKTRSTVVPGRTTSMVGVVRTGSTAEAGTILSSGGPLRMCSCLM